MTASLDHVHELARDHFNGTLSPGFLRGLADLPADRADARAFVARAFNMMTAAGFTGRDLSDTQGELLGSLVARILPGAWDGRVPPITVSGRHRMIDDFIARNRWRPFTETGRLLDLGCGFPPVTTIETADRFTGWTVHGMDPSLPAHVLHDGDGNYATFDANGQIVYFQPAVPSGRNWTSLLADASAARARFMKLFADLARRAPGHPDGEAGIGADGARLVAKPLREYERNGLSFSVGGIGASGIGGYDVVRCFNVLMYFDDPFRTRALDWCGRILNENGIVVSGSNWAFSTESRYFVHQKEGGRLVAREFAFSIDNLAPIAILPWYTTANDDRELATLAPLLRTLRMDHAFRTRLEAVADSLRAEFNICPRDGNGYYHGIEPSRPAEEIWRAVAEIAARMVSAGMADAAARVLQRNGHRARVNEVGHVAIAL